MDHIMHVHQHQQCGDQRDAAMATTGTRSSAAVGVSQVAFVLAAVAFFSLFSSSSFVAAAICAFSSSLPSAAALSARLAALCGFVTTKKALFVLSNAIFLFLAADCRCFFPRVSSMATTSMSDDDVVTASELPPCAVQARSCASYSGNLYYCYNNTEGASTNSPGEQGIKREEAPVSSRLETAGLNGDEANIVALETEQTCGGVAEEELEKLEMDELNRKFEDFIQSRRITWLKEEEEHVLQCQQQQVV
ncbi:hypothetical protein CFC21_022441 [Triticum aestivum]|uniref:DUF4408 domain-containing protein n=2 Tax=Triticum aestivum TaxID=4565 RepID=A0A9R1J7W4_WHEAT|nr:hypothetical protein CFC21_022441 [Triticum aestivum]